jgi:hypothetical protein
MYHCDDSMAAMASAGASCLFASLESGRTHAFVTEEAAAGIWLRFLETYRNLCISPSPEFLRTLAWMRDIQAILKPRQTSNV